MILITGCATSHKNRQWELSIDTSRCAVLQAMLPYGLDYLNDVYALQRDPDLASLAGESGCKVILMHMQGSPLKMQSAPHYADPIGEILQFFEERLSYAVKEGIAEDRIVLDPGIGFGKTLQHNLILLRHINRFRILGRPLLLGPSRKSFIGSVTGADPHNRVFGTAAVIAHLVRLGADILRVHDVRAMRDVVAMTQVLNPSLEEVSVL